MAKKSTSQDLGKTKYPVDQPKTSKAFENGEVHLAVFQSHPRAIITVGGAHSEAVTSDLMTAIDEVLKFHEAE